MQVHIAKTLDDIRHVTELVEGDTWEHARRFLESAPTDPFADHLRWMEEDGRPIACVQIFLHRYPIGRARLGMCLPEYPFVPPEMRRRGHFTRLMADLFEWMRSNGCPLAYSHGRKGLYTGIGYAPCFHHCVVLIRAEDAMKVQAPGRADAVTQADLDDHEHAFRRPFPLGRGLQCRDEGWRPDARCVRLTRAGVDSAITGFVVTSQVLVGRRPNGSALAGFRPPEGGDVLTITDSWAASACAAATLLRTVAEDARGRGFGWIRLNCRRGDALARVAVLVGGELRWSAAQERDHTEDGEDVDAFYLADLRLAVEQMLPEMNARWRDFGGGVPRAIRLAVEDEQVGLELGPEIRLLDLEGRDVPCIRLPRKAMTQAVMGYATPTELALLHEGCAVPVACRAAADALFSAREPHLIHENSAFAKPAQFGLVP